MSLTPKVTPIQMLEARVLKLELAEKYNNWAIGHWYKTFEQPLRKNVDELKEKQLNREADEYISKCKETYKPKEPSLLFEIGMMMFSGALLGFALGFAAVGAIK